jgi:hypothetical protein
MSPLGSGYDDFALPNKYYDGIETYFYVLGQPYTQSVQSAIDITPYLRLKASAPGCFYVSPQYWSAVIDPHYTGSLSQYIAPIPTIDNTDYWSGTDYFQYSNTGGYAILDSNGFYCNGSNNITASYDFYDLSSVTLLFTKSLTFPVGYVVTGNGTGIGSTFTQGDPFDCVFNTTICNSVTHLPSGNYSNTCVGVDCGNATIIPTAINTDWTSLGGLLTPMVLMLGAVLFFGAIVARDTRSSQMALIVVLGGVLVLSFYGFLPWYITILITIIAGFFIVSEMRKGVFGNVTTG